MNKRIKKKHFTWGVIGEIYYYVKKQHQKNYSFVLIDDKVYDKQYGYIAVTEKEVKRAINLLRKEGYIVQYEKFIPRGLGCNGWTFWFMGGTATTDYEKSIK